MSEVIDERKARALRRALLTWYASAKRELPWRASRDPYAIWLSEVMLQQTRVATVLPYYARFLDAFPTVHALADAPLDDVLTMWAGLGYYRRARMLHATATQVRDEHGGKFPDTVEGLRGLHGVGPYTAGAVASIAFGRAAALVDGNVVRVLARLFDVEDDVRGGAGLARIWRIAETLVPERDAGAWNQALMELGATVCAPREPRCLVCPARDACAARARGVERERPVLKPKPKAKREQRVALVATGAGAIILARRKRDGRFGGMWEPPSRLVDDDGRGPNELTAPDALRALLDALGLAEADFTSLGEVGHVVHVLSHRRMEVVVFGGEVAGRRGRMPALRPPGDTAEHDAVELVTEASLASRALTKLARKIMATARFAA